MRKTITLRLLAVLAAVLALPVAYAVAAVVGALVPRNPGWQEPARGVEMFVRTNGVHTDLVLPADAAGVDWYALLPPADVREPASAGGWIAVGWGQREFYLETPTWSDLELGTAVRAMLGGEALMHIEHASRPRPSETLRPLRIDAGGYGRMAAFIRASFRRDQRGRTVPLPGTGYGEHDVFYEADGVYHALRTSNQWTADALAAGGVRIGIWTPFEQGVMWRFPVRGVAGGGERAERIGEPGRGLRALPPYSGLKGSDPLFGSKGL